MFGMMIATGAKFYRVPSPCLVHDLKVKVMDLEFLYESFVKNTSERKRPIQARCPVRRQVLLDRQVCVNSVELNLISSASAHHVSVISRKLEVHPIISQW